MSYSSEFPDYDGEFYCPKGWEDNSWHNDVCPRAMYRIETKAKNIEFSLWQDYVDVNKREFDNAKLYTFQIHVDSDLVYNYETDDFEEIKRITKGVQI